MSIDDFTKPLDTEGKPPDTGQQSAPETDKHATGSGYTDTVEHALQQAESGDFSAITDKGFIESVKKIRVESDEHYLLNIKPRIKSLKAAPIGIQDIERMTKPPKKGRYEQADDNGEGGAGGRQGKADLFIQMMQQWAEVYADESGKPFASFMVEPLDPETGEVLPPHRETWAMDSRKFKEKAALKFLESFGMVAGDTAMKEATDILMAQCDKTPKQAVYLRYAPIPDDGGVYIDLANDDWQVVEVTPTGWRVIPATACKVKFRRVAHSKPLPTPEPGGAIDDLWRHVNIPGQDSRLLVVAWLLEAMRISTPYPVMELVAGQGSAKSTTQDRARNLIDPNAVPLRTAPRSLSDLSVSTVSNHVVSLNNLSHLSTETQDFMCSMSTGGGDAGRKLYSNEDEVVWDVSRPIVMNGINQLVTRPDLADRTICIELPKITATQREDETTLNAAWDSDYPKITGALYDLLSATLRELPNVTLKEKPRMGDFAVLGVAMVRAMGLDVDFVAVFNRNRDDVVRRGVESSPVALALVALIRADNEFKGILKELLTELERHQPKHYDRAGWVKSPRGLGEVLRRLEPALLVYGIGIEKLPRTKEGEPYHIYKFNQQADTVETAL